MKEKYFGMHGITEIFAVNSPSNIASPLGGGVVEYLRTVPPTNIVNTLPTVFTPVGMICCNARKSTVYGRSKWQLALRGNTGATGLPIRCPARQAANRQHSPRAIGSSGLLRGGGVPAYPRGSRSIVKFTSALSFAAFSKNTGRQFTDLSALLVVVACDSWGVSMEADQ
jgi:hypothetical protein